MTPVVLALVLSAADPCVGASTECRRAAHDAIITWRTSYEVCEVKREALQRKLETRTATGAAAVTEAMRPEPDDEGSSIHTIIVAGALGFAVGLLGGFLIAGM